MLVSWFFFFHFQTLIKHFVSVICIFCCLKIIILLLGPLQPIAATTPHVHVQYQFPYPPPPPMPPTQAMPPFPPPPMPPAYAALPPPVTSQPVSN